LRPLTSSSSPDVFTTAGHCLPRLGRHPPLPGPIRASGHPWSARRTRRRRFTDRWAPRPPAVLADWLDRQPWAAGHAIRRVRPQGCRRLQRGPEWEPATGAGRSQHDTRHGPLRLPRRESLLGRSVGLPFLSLSCGLELVPEDAPLCHPFCPFPEYPAPTDVPWPRHALGAHALGCRHGAILISGSWSTLPPFTTVSPTPYLSPCSSPNSRRAPQRELDPTN